MSIEYLGFTDPSLFKTYFEDAEDGYFSNDDCEEESVLPKLLSAYNSFYKMTVKKEPVKKYYRTLINYNNGGLITLYHNKNCEIDIYFGDKKIYNSRFEPTKFEAELEFLRSMGWNNASVNIISQIISRHPTKWNDSYSLNTIKGKLICSRCNRNDLLLMGDSYVCEECHK
jgi:hypothetical protein